MSRPTQIIINTSAMRHNLQRVRTLCPDSKVLAMVKANGYGHGITHSVEHFAADAFGVCCIEEALQIRKCNQTCRIVLMEGVFSAQELELVHQHQLETVIHHEAQYELLQQHTASRPLKVWLKINTGMHRLGFPATQALERIKQLEILTAIEIVCVMTHFADADDLTKPTTDAQINCFNEVLSNNSLPRSLANSAAILSKPETHAAWVRPGIMLYGISPFHEKLGLDFDLQPVMTFTSEIIAIQDCKQGAAIGYGGTYICPEDMPVGVVAVGYGDGYPRHMREGTPVLINGQRSRLVGRVSMDMITVDLRNIPNAKIGDKVTLWGDDLPVEEIARCANTIAYELVCQVQMRVLPKLL